MPIALTADSHPHVREDAVLRHALAVEVLRGEQELRVGADQVGREAVPADRLDVVGRHAVAGVIQAAEQQLLVALAPHGRQA